MVHRAWVVFALAQAAAAEPDPSLLVVAPRALVPALADFVAFKASVLPTELVELESALKSPGTDDPERLKRYLFERWVLGGDRRLRYVLLVGDADVMPVRYMVLDRNTDAAFHYAFYPSDLYYADLTRADGSFENWNSAQGSGVGGATAPEDAFHARYFGEVRGEHFKSDPINYDYIDYKPELAVGRWPVSTPGQAAVVAAKTIAYERAMASPGDAAAVGLVASGGWVENRPRMDALAARLGPAWSVSKLYWGRSEGPEATPAPDAAQVVQLLNRGVSLVLHSGHGSDTSWEGAISTRNIPEMHNAARPAIMMSAGCSTARLAALPPYEAYTDIDGVDHKGTDHGEVFAAPPPPPAPYQTGKHNPTGLGEELLRAGPGGAVAYIGCNTGSQPCGLTLLDGLTDAIARRSSAGAGAAVPVRIGDCWADAIATYYERENLAGLRPTESWYPPSIFFQGMKFMLFGDPSIPVHTPR